MSFLGRPAYLASLVTPIIHTYTSGSGTEVFPPGAVNVVVELWGPGGGGGAGQTNICTGLDGSGGGSGSYCKTTLTGISGGQTLNYALGTAGVGGTYPSGDGTAGVGNSTVTSGTKAIGTMTGKPGGGGQGAGGTAGTAGALATGGVDTNTAGVAGTVGGNGGVKAGTNGSNSGGNGSHAGLGNPGGNGNPKVIFYYT